MFKRFQYFKRSLGHHLDHDIRELDFAIFYTLGVIIGHRVEKRCQPIFYASRTLNPTQENYTMTTKELLVVVDAFDKSRPYLILSNTIVFTYHFGLIRWVLLLQEFGDKKGMKNVAVDHLSILENPNLEVLEEIEIDVNLTF